MQRKTDAIIDRIGTGREQIIPLLQAIQQEFNYLPSDALNRLYERTEIDRAQLISVATFYSQLRMVPYGKHIIKVCIGTACHVKGAGNVYDAFRRELQLEADDITTADGTSFDLFVLHMDAGSTDAVVPVDIMPCNTAHCTKRNSDISTNANTCAPSR